MKRSEDFSRDRIGPSGPLKFKSEKSVKNKKFLKDSNQFEIMTFCLILNYWTRFDSWSRKYFFIKLQHIYGNNFLLILFCF